MEMTPAVYSGESRRLWLWASMKEERIRGLSMKRKFFTSLCCGIAFMATELWAEMYSIDTAHASVGFSVSHLVISKVRGEFRTFDGTLELGEDGNLIGAAATIRSASIDTGNKKRDDHLRNADFLDVENHPQLIFKSTKVRQNQGKKLLVGDLTLRGVTREVELSFQVNGPIQDPWGNKKIGFEAHTIINRTDFGIAWNKALETGGWVVGEEVEISIQLEAALNN